MPEPDRRQRAARRRLLIRRIIGRRWRARWIWASRIIVVAIVLLAAAWIALTRSPLTRKLALGPLARQFGVELQADAVYVDLGGTLVMERVRAMMPGVPGLPGRFLEVDRLEADVDWLSAIGGTPTVRRVNLPANATLRVSQSVADATLNIDPLLGGPSASGSTGVLPTIIAHAAVLELGEHDGAAYTPLKRLTVEGALQPSPRGGYQVSMRQLGAIGPGSASHNRLAALDGMITSDTATMVVQNIALADWKPESIPSRSRWLLEKLNLSGEISRTTLLYAAGSGVVAKIDLAGVAMDLPVPPEPGMRASGPMRLSGVNGTITISRAGLKADLAGLLGDLPYSVRLDYRGLDLVSPFICRFECKDFLLEENPALLPYAPHVVRDRLANFSSPTARVSASVVVSRGLSGEGADGEPRIDGLIEFEEGTAAFHKFPYRFENMSGIVEFDDQRIRILEITGEAPSGATLVARGRIEPPDEYAYVEIDVDVHGVPTDPTLADALGPGRGEILPALFDPNATARLRDADLLDPEFNLGGNGSIRVRVIREHGIESIWRYRVDAEFPTLGIVPTRFPLPIAGRNVTLEIEDDIARIASGEFRSLGGGEARITGGVGIVRGADGQPTLRPELVVNAERIPIDRRLAFALAESTSQPNLNDDLLAAGLAGGITANITIAPRENGSLGYDLHALALDTSFASGGVTGVAAIEANGTERGIDLRAQGSLEAQGLDVCPEFTASASLGSDRRAVEIRLGSLDLAAPVEALVRRWAPEAADRAASVRNDHDPSGRADLRLTIDWDQSSPARTVARFDAFQNVTITAGSWRHRFESPSGAFEIRGVDGLLDFDALEADVHSTRLDASGPIDPRFLDVPSGRVTLNGTWPLGEPRAEQALSLSLRDGRIDSPLLHDFLRGPAPAVTTLIEERLAEGIFDAHLRVVASPGATPMVRGTIEPRVLSFVSAGDRLDGDLAGEVSFTPSEISARGLRAVGDGWGFGGSGDWRATPDGWSMDSTLDAHADSLRPTLRELLPEAVRSAMSAIKLDAAGPIELSGARLRLDDRAGNRDVRFEGDLRFTNASLDPGLPVTRADGRAALGYAGRWPDAPDVTIDLDCQSLRAMNVRMTGVRALVHSVPASGDLVVPVLTGDCHGGRVSAKAEVRSAAREGTPREFFVDARVAGVRLAPLLSDLSSQFDDTPSQPAEGPGLDASRGVIDGELSLGGVLGEDSARRGRGTFTVSQGRVMRMPLVVPLLEVANLQLPRNEKLDYAQAAFYIEPGRIVFEDLSIFSRALAVFGSGDVLWPSLELDLEFESRSARPIPILSAILQGIRSQLINTAVRGTVREPQVRLQQASGRILERAIGVPGPGRPARWSQEQSALRRARAGDAP